MERIRDTALLMGGICPYPNHKADGTPYCPLCGSTNVVEQHAEGNPQHKHTCLNRNCVNERHQNLMARYNLKEDIDGIQTTAEPERKVE